MATVKVCDRCMGEGRGLVEAPIRFRIPKRPHLSLDVCRPCGDQIPKDYPKINAEYVKFVYHLQGLELSDEDAEMMLRR